MSHTYQDSSVALEYLDFMGTEDGKTQREVLGSAILERLKKLPKSSVLEVGCGTGWLAKDISKVSNEVCGCDISSELLQIARTDFPNVRFEQTDICEKRPFPEKKFDVVIANMALHDCTDQVAALKNIFSSLSQNGNLIVTIPNPYYAFPVGAWKRGVFGYLFREFPKLVLTPYNFFAKKNRQFVWRNNIPGYFYPLSEQINNALVAGFSLNFIHEVTIDDDSPHFDLRYRLFRFPVFLFLEFKKIS